MGIGKTVEWIGQDFATFICEYVICETPRCIQPQEREDTPHVRTACQDTLYWHAKLEEKEQ